MSRPRSTDKSIPFGPSHLPGSLVKRLDQELSYQASVNMQESDEVQSSAIEDASSRTLMVHSD